jgi:hypothetical protein
VNGAMHQGISLWSGRGRPTRWEPTAVLGHAVASNVSLLRLPYVTMTGVSVP